MILECKTSSITIFLCASLLVKSIGFHCMIPFQLILLIGMVMVLKPTAAQSLPGCPDCCGRLNFTVSSVSSCNHWGFHAKASCGYALVGVVNKFDQFPSKFLKVKLIRLSKRVVRTEHGCTKLGVNHHYRRHYLGCKVPAGLSIFLMGSCFAGVYWSVKKRGFLNQKKRFFEQNGGIMLEQLLLNLQTAKFFTEEDIKLATNNFNENRVIGEGRYGKVYQGILLNGKKVAIKKYKIGDLTQFVNEVAVHFQILHQNVVVLLGCCLETEDPLLVSEFIPNGTLFHHIHMKGKVSVLPWKLRLQIALETAGALAYFHSEARKLILHMDVKTANILLDENYTVKLLGFGASKMIPKDQNQITTLVQGTLGYLDPEYFYTNQLTEKSDVYSFGVVLAELLTSKKAISFDRPECEINLAKFFVSAVEEDRLLDVLDGDIAWDEENVEQVKKVANLAKMCLSLNGKERPTMFEVLVQLREI